MGVLDELLSRIFLSLENFFQKATELDVFEDFVFSYKIKLASVEKCSTQFLSAFAELENELQLAVKECMHQSENHWKLNADGLIKENIQSDNICALDDNAVTVIAQSSSNNKDHHTLLGISEVQGNACLETPSEDADNKSLEPQGLHSDVQLDNVLGVSELAKCYNDTALNISSQNEVAVVSATSNTLCTTSNENSTFKCESCLRKFRTSVKLNKHSCKKRCDNKITVQPPTTNIETASISVCIDDSTASSAEEVKLLQSQLEETTDEIRHAESSEHSSISGPQIHSHQNDNGFNQFPNGEPDLPVYSCALCCISFLDKSRWDEHVCKEREGITNCKRGLVPTRSSLEERHRFVCGICSETYRSLGRIMYHLVRCFSGPYPCEVCSNTFTTRSELNYHKKKQHKGVESFFCDECGLGFMLRTSLQKHLINRHENLQGEYHCDIAGCRLVFPKKIFLTHHKINEHRLERKFLCQICGNKFYNRCSLSSHLETHSDKKQFTCPVCNRVLKTKEKLTLHIRTHTGERPYSCTMCGKSFIAKSKLEEHSRRHRGEKRHKCNNCGKLYANGFDLKQHNLKKCNPNPSSMKKQVQIKSVEVLTASEENDLILLRKNKSQPSEIRDQVVNLEQPPQSSQQIFHHKKDNSPALQQMQSNSNTNTVTTTAAANGATSTASSASGLIVQVDSNGRVIPVQTTAVHVVDYVPYYPSPDPIHIVMPQQTLLLTGYDNITY